MCFRFFNPHFALTYFVLMKNYLCHKEKKISEGLFNPHSPKGRVGVDYYPSKLFPCRSKTENKVTQVRGGGHFLKICDGYVWPH